jgi:hypothetical protein
MPREEIEALLRGWERGEIAVQQVHSEAERLISEWNWPEFPRSDPRSIVVEILTQLEIMNHQLITEEDIPAMLAFLSVQAGCEADGWQAWEAYWKGINFEARRRKLAGHSYYSA